MPYGQFLAFLTSKVMLIPTREFLRLKRKAEDRLMGSLLRANTSPPTYDDMIQEVENACGATHAHA